MKELLLAGILTAALVMFSIEMLLGYTLTVVNTAGESLQELMRTISNMTTINYTMINDLNNKLLYLVNESNKLIDNAKLVDNNTLVVYVSGVPVAIDTSQLKILCKTLYELNRTMAENLAICSLLASQITESQQP
ncbi:MAG: hypothetical protein DSY37_03950 [Hyperthermus sp.]|nr:MAG: hypothetical protein DSY37_03950 [Hyperthermus sp.]